MDFVTILLGVTALGVTTWVVYWAWIKPRLYRTEKVPKELHAKRVELATVAVRALTRQRRVLILAFLHQVCRDIERAHLERWIEEHGEEARKPEYRYIHDSKGLYGVDHCTLLIHVGWARNRSPEEILNIQHRIKIMELSDVDIYYIDEEYYR